ncbi:unnamed protein product [Dicrocoelium dendriticum]|nr:unnamed protein product [Dicrocoelium dendriticum]
MLPPIGDSNPVRLADADLYEQPPIKLALRINSAETLNGPYNDTVVRAYSSNSVGQLEPTNSNGRFASSMQEIKVHNSAHEFQQGDMHVSSDNSVSSNGSRHNARSHCLQNPVEKMSRTNLYIKGLPDSFNDEKLWNLPPDPVQIKSVKAATDEDCKCRGYGFIDFMSAEAANEALRHIRETYPAFTIKFAKENEKDKTNLYVTNIPKSWTTKDSDQLKVVFERFGAIQSAFVMMERSTNRTTGVGFVRFANERDALAALDSIKKDPIVLPECTNAIEAKFADKHNPDTRRRRYPVANLLTTPHVNNLMGYPMTICNGSSTNSQDTITALLNGGLSVHPATQNSLVTLQAIQNKNEYAQRLAQSLFHNSVPTKLHHSSNNPNQLGLSDFGITHPNVVPQESQLNVLAAAASALMSTGRSQGFPNNSCLRVPHACGTGTIAPALSGSLISTNPLSLLATNPVSPAEVSMLDHSGLYRCSAYGNELYRHSQQQQQQQQLIAAAMAAMNGSHASGSMYTHLAEMNPYLGYSNLLHPSQSSVNGTAAVNSCLTPNGPTIGTMYANPNTGLFGASTLLAPTEPINLVSPRLNNGLHSWVIPHQLVKTGANDTVPLPQTAMITNQDI